MAPASSFPIVWVDAAQGPSPYDEASHARFREKYSLPFTLLADPGHRVADDYGV